MVCAISWCAVCSVLCASWRVVFLCVLLMCCSCVVCPSVVGSHLIVISSSSYRHLLAARLLSSPLPSAPLVSSRLCVFVCVYLPDGSASISVIDTLDSHSTTILTYAGQHTETTHHNTAEQKQKQHINNRTEQTPHTHH